MYRYTVDHHFKHYKVKSMLCQNGKSISNENQFSYYCLFLLRSTPSHQQKGASSSYFSLYNCSSHRRICVLVTLLLSVASSPLLVTTYAKTRSLFAFVFRYTLRDWRINTTVQVIGCRVCIYIIDSYQLIISLIKS